MVICTGYLHQFILPGWIGKAPLGNLGSPCELQFVLGQMQDPMRIKLLSSKMGALIPGAIIKCDLTSSMWSFSPSLSAA